MCTVNQLLTDHFRCPDLGVAFEWPATNQSPVGYFRFGDDVVCFAESAVAPVAQTAGESLHDAFSDVCLEAAHCRLPFDPAQVVDNLRLERYIQNTESTGNGHTFHSLFRRAYYGVRPLLPVAVRKHLQRVFLAGRRNIPFPNWPVDRTVDRFLEKLLALSLRAQHLERVPFIWFWPDGKSSAAIMTHDVETQGGVEYCSGLMNIDEGYDIRSSFQLVPEDRYVTPDSLFNEIRRRGCEINVHDLNHDGRLYWKREEFLRRATKINDYAKAFGANGFRAGVLYRNLDWYGAFDLSYDMSVPNVGHLDPQTGGCCTVMPYFIGRILELPVTTTQDYPLFQILGDYSIGLWLRQISMIREGHGLISFITHPDYLVEHRARATYAMLLAHLARLRSESGLWMALPREVNEWWRHRSQMRLVRTHGNWQIEGPGRERARIAYANLNPDDRIQYTVEGRATAHGMRPTPNSVRQADDV